MKSKVYMVDFRSRSAEDNIIKKIIKLLNQPEFEKLFSEEDLCALKIHFGEKGNEGYISPVWVRQVVDWLKAKKVKPFLTDTNTLYKGSRANAVDHMQTAIEHGFTYAVVNAPLLIADGLKSSDYDEIVVNQKNIRGAKIARNLIEADSMVVLTHFKGHEMSGFGGAIKNLAMGSASVSGKMDQHSARPFITKKNCTGCGLCKKACDWYVYKIENKKSIMDIEKCVGCGACLHVCPHDALGVNWDTDISEFIERMTEYALGAVCNKDDNTLYLNFLAKMSPECDCYAYSDTAIAPDIGILASTDPIAIDKASYDLVNAAPGNPNSALPKKYKKGQDKFKALFPYIDNQIQINYGESIGLGNSQYEIIAL